MSSMNRPGVAGHGRGSTLPALAHLPAPTRRHSVVHRADAESRRRRRDQPTQSSQSASSALGARAHRVYDVGRIVDDTADAGGMPAATFTVPLAFAHHEVDLFGRMPVIDILHIGRNQTGAEQHVAALFQPHRPDDVRIGVAVMKRVAAGFRAGTPAPTQLRRQRFERFRQRRDLQRRPRMFECGVKMAMRRRWNEHTRRDGAN